MLCIQLFSLCGGHLLMRVAFNFYACTRMMISQHGQCMALLNAFLCCVMVFDVADAPLAAPACTQPEPFSKKP